MGGRVLDITGQTFGRLTVLAYQPHKPGRGAWWLCECQCGALKVIRGVDLRTGGVQSCGCLQREARLRHGGASGKKRSPEYIVWRSIVARCCNPKSTGYAYYGGLGVTVCDQWRRDFAAFLRDVGPRPSLHHSIDRIKNERGYLPGNVRWATAREQARNRRNNVYVWFDGVRVLLVEACERLGLPEPLVRHRLAAGWDFARALKTPFKKPMRGPAVKRDA
jgi:hypothetical protein